MRLTNITMCIKRLICLVLSGIMLLMLCACSAQSNQSISLYDLNKSMSEVAEFSQMKYASSADDDPEDLFENISEMSYSKVEGFFINYAVNGTGNADEIACIQVKDKRDINEAVASLNAHLKKRIGLYTSYDKSQLDKLSNAVVATKGNIAVLIVGDKSGEMEKAFYSFFEE